jgi:hypothetical protein
MMVSGGEDDLRTLGGGLVLAGRVTRPLTLSLLRVDDVQVSNSRPLWAVSHIVAAPDWLVVILSGSIKYEQIHVLYHCVLLDDITQRRNQLAVIGIGQPGVRVKEFESY